MHYRIVRTGQAVVFGILPAKGNVLSRGQGVNTKSDGCITLRMSHITAARERAVLRPSRVVFVPAFCDA